MVGYISHVARHMAYTHTQQHPRGPDKTEPPCCTATSLLFRHPSTVLYRAWVWAVTGLASTGPIARHACKRYTVDCYNVLQRLHVMLVVVWWSWVVSGRTVVGIWMLPI